MDTLSHPTERRRLKRQRQTNNPNRLLDDLEHAAVTTDNRRSSWTLSKDAELCTFLQRFSSHLHDKVSDLSETFATLDRTIDKVNRSTMSVTLDYMLLSDEQSMEYTRCCSDDSSEDKPDLASMSGKSRVQEEDGNTIFSGANAVINTMITNAKDEEEAAIERGIQTALAIFYDHPDEGNPHDYVSDHFFGFEDDVEDERYNSSHCYESSQGDIFNQRPLPLVVGGDDFLESEDVGIGGGGSGRGEQMGQHEEDVDQSQRQQQWQAQPKELSLVAAGRISSPVAEEERVTCNKMDAGSNDELIVKRHLEDDLEATLQSTDFSDVSLPPLSQLNLGPSDLDSSKK